MRSIVTTALVLAGLTAAPVCADDCLARPTITAAKRCWETRAQGRDKFTSGIARMYWERHKLLDVAIEGNRVLSTAGLALGTITPSGDFVIGQNGASLISDNGAAFTAAATVKQFRGGSGYSLMATEVVGKKLGAAARLVGRKLKK